MNAGDRRVCESADDAFLPSGVDAGPCSSSCAKHGLKVVRRSEVDPSTVEHSSDTILANGLGVGPVRRIPAGARYCYLTLTGGSKVIAVDGDVQLAGTVAVHVDVAQVGVGDRLLVGRGYDAHWCEVVAVEPSVNGVTVSYRSAGSIVRAGYLAGAIVEVAG